MSDTALRNRVLGSAIVVVGGLALSAARADTTATFNDVSQPGDRIFLVNGVNDDDPNSGAPPGAEGPTNLTDDTTNKYLNFLDLGSGAVVVPSFGSGISGTIVTGLKLYTANDAPDRDPATYRLEGSLTGNDAGPFTLISEGSLALPTGRNGSGQPITNATSFQIVTFTNTTPYKAYRLTFPELRNAGANNSMQIAEAEFIGSIVKPTTPAPAGRHSILRVGDYVIPVNGVNDGDASTGGSPNGEGAGNIGDGTTSKYLHFNDLGSGFIATPIDGASLVDGMRLFTANDGPERDPGRYKIEGSVDGTTWTLISEGALDLPMDRNPGGQSVDTLDNLFYQDVSFSNSTTYLSYRVTFPELRDAAVANSMQIGEVQLLGVLVPEPTGLSLLALGSLALLRRRHR